MIKFNGWILSGYGEAIHQYDNLSRRLEILGALPEGWDWVAMVKPEKLGDALDIIALYPMEGGIGADLTADQLCVDGYYHIQLRGTQGEKVRHSSVLQIYVSPSLTGEGQWPELPSEFGQMETRLRDIANHPPIPGETGYWLLWDPDGQQYVESEFPLPEGGGGGATDAVQYVPQELTEEEQAQARTNISAAKELLIVTVADGKASHTPAEIEAHVMEQGGMVVLQLVVNDVPVYCYPAGILGGQLAFSGVLGAIVAVAVIAADGSAEILYDDLTGPQGPQGEQGPAGEAGHTPVKGVDYWTNEDQQSIVSDVLDALPVWTGGLY